MTENTGREEMKNAGPAWIKLIVRAEPEPLEILGQLWMEMGAGGLEEMDGGVAVYVKPGEAPAYREAVLDLARERGWPVEIESGEIAEENWWESWKAFFHPFRASGRLWVRPSWEDLPAPEPGMKTLVVDPGRAFGTGAHETTRMCLDLIDRTLQAESHEEMFDVGSGSGILTVAARLLGVQRVVAIDVDPLAVSATVENCAANGVEEGVLAVRGDVRAVGGRYGLVVCNILYQIIMGIAPELVKRVAPGGTLVLSGFLVQETGGVKAMFGNLGMVSVEALEMGPWGALVLKAP